MFSDECKRKTRNEIARRQREPINSPFVRSSRELALLWRKKVRHAWTSSWPRFAIVAWLPRRSTSDAFCLAASNCTPLSGGREKKRRPADASLGFVAVKRFYAMKWRAPGRL